MARPQRNDCDYFPFFVKQGKTFSLLRHRWPLEGIGFFTELCILLTRTPNHHIRVESDIDFEYVLGDMGCSVERANEIMNLLTATGKVHKNLWENHRVIVIPDLLKSLEYAYEKRASKIISVEEIGIMYTETPVSGADTVVSGDNPGSFTPEVKERILKKRKEKREGRVPRFIPPTLDQVLECGRTYSDKSGHGEFTRLEAEKFIDHFSSNGWKVGGKAPMKDWEASVRNWVRRWANDHKIGRIGLPLDNRNTLDIDEAN